MALLYQKDPCGVYFPGMETGKNNKYLLGDKAGGSRLPALLLALLAAFSLFSCSSRIGWGVVLWTVKGTTAKAGSIVPVYLKSNITKLYVIGIEDGKSVKMEVPLWQVEMFGSKGAARKRVEKMGSFVSLYMIAARDGLPVREKPSNADGVKRVYRLHQNEMVKVLERTEGEAVYTGDARLAGDWYRVLTMDGTEGYAFSYTMRMFDESSGDVPEQQVLQTNPETINAIFSRTWRPAWYSSMLDEGSVDLDYFSLRFGLFGDAINRQIRVELPSLSKVFKYSTITQDKEWLVFGTTGLRIKQESLTSILASWGPSTNVLPEDSAGWMPGISFVRFIVVDRDIREAIRQEESRRSEAIKGFFAQASASRGGSGSGTGLLNLSSSVAGTLELWPSGSYSWKENQGLPAGFAPSGGTDGEQKGTIVFGARLAGGLASAWQGGFSLYPDSTGLRSDYVYRIDGRSIVVAKAVLSGPASALGEVDKHFGTADFEFSGK